MRIYYYLLTFVYIGKITPCPWPCVCVPNKNEVRCYGSNITNEVIKEIAQKIPLKRVLHIYIRGGTFDMFPVRDFRRNPLLRSLHIDRNKLTTVPTDLSSVFPNLQRLNIGENNVMNIKRDSLNGLLELRSLQLERNSLTNIENGTFRNTRKLKQLDLSWNNLTRLTPDSLSGLQNADSLNLNHNQIKELPSELLYNFTSTLLSINFAHNNIKLLPNNLFSSGTELRELDISFNRIEKIADKAFANVTRIGTVYLENNTLRDIPTSAIERISSGIFILFNNPLYCSCDMYIELAPYFTKKLQFMGTCVQPPHLRDQSLASLMVNKTEQEACQICGRLNVTCDNGGECVSVNRSSFLCNCTQGFEGKYCELKKQVNITTNLTRITSTPTSLTTKTTPSATTSTSTTTNLTNSQRIIGNETEPDNDDQMKGLEYELASKIVWFFLLAIFFLLVFTKIVHTVWKIRHKRDIQTTEYLLY